MGVKKIALTLLTLLPFIIAYFYYALCTTNFKFVGKQTSTLEIVDDDSLEKLLKHSHNPTVIFFLHP